MWSYVKSLKYYVGVLIEIIHVIIQAVSQYIFSITEKNIRNEIVLITGAGRGLGNHEIIVSYFDLDKPFLFCSGQQMALLFAKRGAIVVLCDINEIGNAQTAELVSKELASTMNNEKRIFSYTCDIGNRDEVQRLVEKIQQEVGEITMLVNNGSFSMFSSEEDSPLIRFLF